ncbi:hypothetical protein HNQ48_001755 [Melissococcus plutonius]|nr:hypothetical protein [Melissococcus plutonius]
MSTKEVNHALFSLSTSYKLIAGMLRADPLASFLAASMVRTMVGFPVSCTILPATIPKIPSGHSSLAII